MDILSALLAAVVSGVFSWFITRWQYKQQLAAKERELDTQSKLVKITAATEARIRVQVEEYKHLYEFMDALFRHFIEIDHDAGHVINGSPGRNLSKTPLAEIVHERVRTVRALVRGEAQTVGDGITHELLAATDMWMAFLENPEQHSRREAHGAAMDASRKLQIIVKQRSMTLGADF